MVYLLAKQTIAVSYIELVHHISRIFQNVKAFVYITDCTPPLRGGSQKSTKSKYIYYTKRSNLEFRVCLLALLQSDFFEYLNRKIPIIALHCVLRNLRLFKSNQRTPS